MRTLLSVVACAALVSPAPSPAFGQDRPRQSASALEARLPELDIESVPLDDALAFLRSATTLNVVVRWDVLEAAGIERDAPVSLHVRNVRLSQALWLLMHEAGRGEVELAYRLADGVLVISTAADLGHEMVTRAYDLTDLISRIERFGGAPRVRIAARGGEAPFDSPGGDEGSDPADESGRRIEQLRDLVQETVEPDSWQEHGGRGTLAVFDRWLVVRNTLAVHQAIGGPLTE